MARQERIVVGKAVRIPEAKYSEQRVNVYPRQLQRLFQQHVSEMYTKGLPTSVNAEELIQHASSVVPVDPHMRNIPRNAMVRFSNNSEPGSSLTRQPYFYAIARNNGVVLYRQNNQALGIANDSNVTARMRANALRHHPTPQEDTLNLLVDTERRTVTLFSGGMDNIRMKEILERGQDVSKAYWQEIETAINQNYAIVELARHVPEMSETLGVTRDNEEYAPGLEIRYHPENGCAVYARNADLFNYRPEGNREESWLFHQESTLSSEEMITQGYTGVIHVRTPLARVGPRRDYHGVKHA